MNKTKRRKKMKEAYLKLAKQYEEAGKLRLAEQMTESANRCDSTP